MTLSEDLLYYRVSTLSSPWLFCAVLLGMVPLESVLHLEFCYKGTWGRIASTCIGGMNCTFILIPDADKSVGRPRSVSGSDGAIQATCHGLGICGVRGFLLDARTMQR